MAATKETISEWFDRGIREGHTHLIVVCDTFDHEDFPVWADGNEDVKQKYANNNGESVMLKVMEVYQLPNP
jgi:hypothetical protein